MASEKNEKAVEVTLEQVKVMISDAIQGLVLKDQLKAALEEAGVVILTEERVRDILEEMREKLLPSFAEGISLGPLEPRESENPLRPIDPKWLKGLTFRTTKTEKADNGEILKVPVKRDLTPEDVLSWADKGNAIVIVTMDGQKHTVKTA